MGTLSAVDRPSLDVRCTFQVWRGPVCAALAALSSACASMRPPAQVPSAAPAAWHASLPHGMQLPHDGSSTALAGWWARQGDPLLVDLIEAAQAQSPNVASAAARIAEARSARAAAGAALLPTLDGVGSVGRSGGGVATASAPTATSASTGASAATVTENGATAGASSAPVTTWQAGLQTRWEIDLFGRLRSNRDAAALRLVGADARWHQARVSVAAETATTYVDERACQRQTGVVASDSNSRAETLRLSELSMRAGFTAPADTALVRAGAADASARLTQQRGQCALLRNALVALTGINAGALGQRLDAAPPATAPLAMTTIGSVSEVPAGALAQRPDVFAAELEVAAASAAVGAAEAERYPRLALSGSISALQLRTSGFRSSFDTWSIGPLALTLPLLNYGSITGNIEAARARYDEAAALYRANVRQAVSEVEQALINLQSSDARSGDARSSVDNFEVALRAAQARYDSGLANLFDLESARRLVFVAQTAQVSLERERAEAWIALYRAMGGGWARPDSEAAQATASITP
ncbi:MAG: efflux transporter outer membrane subunit [Variovorax sp.]